MENSKRRIVVLNRYSNKTIDYDIIFKGIDCEFIAITKKKQQDNGKEVFAKYYIVESLDDVENLEKIIDEIYTEKKIDAIVASHEFDIDVAAKIREKYGIPGQSVESALAFRNKVVMKEYLSKKGIRTPRFMQIDNYEKLMEFKNKEGYPFIVKPINGAGSMGFHIIENDEQLNEFKDTNPEYPFDAEEYIVGDMYHVDGIFYNNEVQCIQPSKYVNGCLAYRENRYVGSITVDEKEENYKRLCDITAATLKALPAPDYATPFHAEFFCTAKNEIIFCEIASRVGGGRINTVFDNKKGIDLMKTGILAQIIEINDFTIKETAGYYGWMMIPQKVGKLVDIISDMDFDFVIDPNIRRNKIGGSFHGGECSASEIVSTAVKGDSVEDMLHKFDLIEEWYNSNVKFEEE